MNIHNHIIFNIFSIFIIKNLNFIKNKSIKEWFFILFGSILTCLLPDIDHPNSFIGRKVKLISNFIYYNFGHREITHSLFILLIINLFFNKFIISKFNLLPNSTYNGLIIGYMNHILADMCTIKGVSFLWPIKIKIKIPFINLLNNYNIFTLVIIFISIYSIINYFIIYL